MTYSNNNNSTTALVYSFAKTQSAWYSRKERAPYLVRLHLSRKPGRNRGCVGEKKTGERRVDVRFSPTSKIIKTTVTPLTPGSIRSGLGPYPGARRSYRSWSGFTSRTRGVPEDSMTTSSALQSSGECGWEKLLKTLGRF